VSHHYICDLYHYTQTCPHPPHLRPRAIRADFSRSRPRDISSWERGNVSPDTCTYTINAGDIQGMTVTWLPLTSHGQMNIWTPGWVWVHTASPHDSHMTITEVMW